MRVSAFCVIVVVWLQLSTEGHSLHHRRSAISGDCKQAIGPLRSRRATKAQSFRRALTLSPWSLDEVNRRQLSPRYFRLPKTIKPISYRIKLTPYIENENFTFDGKISITLQVVTTTNRITLHANQLTIDTSAISVSELGTGRVFPVTGTDYEKERHFFTVSVGEMLVVGSRYILTFHRFQGLLNSDGTGFYRSSYLESGVKRWVLATEFESTHARQAFPCFDEPALRAKVTLSISRPVGMIAVSNMPQAGNPELDIEHTNQVRYWDHFEETPSMSIYLVAFAVTDFVIMEDTAAHVRVFAEASKISEARYALAITPPIIKWMENYTGIPFNLPKLDFIATPVSGSVENWGFVAFEESVMIVPRDVLSEDKQESAITIAHEIAHQWFGNLVALGWWDYLWLKEGFASYFHYSATAQVETNWRLGEQFVVRELQTVMRSDASQSSYPMTRILGSPSSINDHYGSITYVKGMSILYMLEHMLTPATFQKGLRRYFTNRSYKSATPDDLYHYLNTQLHEDDPRTDIDVKTVMDTWTLQPGFPVLNVTRDYGGNYAVVTQERFLLRPQFDYPDTYVYKWHVPLTYTTQDSPDFVSTRPRDWLRVDEPTHTILGLPGADQWVLFNVKHTGFYRVNYDARNWKLLAAYLNSDRFHEIIPINRAQLIDDAFNLASMGFVEYTMALDITRYLYRDVDYISWYPALRGFSSLKSRFINSKDYDLFREYMLQLIEARYSSLGFEEGPKDDHVTKLNRAASVSWACELHHEPCSHSAAAVFARWMEAPETNPIKPDLREAVYCAALRSGGGHEWNFLFGQYVASSDSQEKTMIMQALGCTEDEDIIRSFLDMSFENDSPIEEAGNIPVISSVIRNSVGIDVALDYVMQHFTSLTEFYGDNTLPTMMLIEISGMCKYQNQANKMQRFLIEKKSELGALAKYVGQSINSIERNIAWLSKTGRVIKHWIKDNTNLGK